MPWQNRTPKRVFRHPYHILNNYLLRKCQPVRTEFAHTILSLFLTPNKHSSKYILLISKWSPKGDKTAIFHLPKIIYILFCLPPQTEDDAIGIITCQCQSHRFGQNIHSFFLSFPTTLATPPRPPPMFIIAPPPQLPHKSCHFLPLSVPFIHHISSFPLPQTTIVNTNFRFFVFCSRERPPFRDQKMTTLSASFLLQKTFLSVLVICGRSIHSLRIIKTSLENILERMWGFRGMDWCDPESRSNPDRDGPEDMGKISSYIWKNFSTFLDWTVIFKISENIPKM